MKSVAIVSTTRSARERGDNRLRLVAVPYVHFLKLGRKVQQNGQILGLKALILNGIVVGGVSNNGKAEKSMSRRRIFEST